MFERFTHPAREAVVRARTEARDLGQSPIGTQHLLLALIGEPAGPVATALRAQQPDLDARAVRTEIVRRVDSSPPEQQQRDTDAEDAAALRSIGIDLDAVRRAIEENFGPGALQLPPEPQRRGRFGGLFTSRGHVPFSRRSKKVLELSLREALRLKHDFIAPEHIMLGILREGEGLAMLILSDAGVDTGRLRTDLTAALGRRAA